MNRNLISGKSVESLRKAVIYIRRSDKKQGDNHSLEIQERLIREWAETNNVCIRKKFIDDMESAYLKSAKKRPKMLELLHYVKTNDVDVVVFNEESRVSRRITDFVTEIWEEIRNLKPQVQFYSASNLGFDEWDPNNPVTQIRLTMAAEESVTKAMRSKDTQNAILKEEKRRPGSALPYGIMHDNTDKNKLIPNDDAPVVYLIFHLSSWGYSISRIADILNSYQIPSPKGGIWHSSSIDLILHNHVYVGDLAWNVRKSRTRSARRPIDQITLLEDVYNPIIPRWLWILAHQSLKEKANLGKKVSSPYLISGIALCGKCECPLETIDTTPGHAKKKYRYYVCPSCKNKVEANSLHEVVRNRIEKDFRVEKSVLVKTASSTLSQWKKQLQTEIEKLNADIEVIKINEYVGIESISSKTLRAIKIGKNSLSNRLDEFTRLLRDVEELQDTISEVFPEYLNSGILTQLNQVELRTFLQHAIEKIEVEFGNIHHLKIEFRLSPFTLIEEHIGHITETV